MNDISSVLPMLSQIMGTPQNSLPQQLQQLVNSAGAGNSAGSPVNNLLGSPAKNTAADSLTLSPAAVSLQQLLNSEMSNGGQNGESADSEGGLTGLAQLKGQGELAATLINAKLQKGISTPASENYAQQYARQSDIHSAGLNSANVHFVRHIIEGK